MFSCKYHSIFCFSTELKQMIHPNLYRDGLFLILTEMGSKHLLDNVQMEFSGYLESMYIFKSTNQCPYLWFIQKNVVHLAQKQKCEMITFIDLSLYQFRYGLLTLSNGGHFGEKGGEGGMKLWISKAHNFLTIHPFFTRAQNVWFKELFPNNISNAIYSSFYRPGLSNNSQINL